MELFATDRERLAFLLETDAALDLDFEALEAQAEAAAEEPSPEERPKYITNYIGSKQKLVDWIWKHTPEGVESVVDAFSGSAVVAYMYKTKGLQVIANDRLRYCHHAAKAIIENNSVRLSEDEIEALLADNAKAGSFVQENFKGIFFAKGVHALIHSCAEKRGHVWQRGELRVAPVALPDQDNSAIVAPHQTEPEPHHSQPAHQERDSPYL